MASMAAVGTIFTSIQNTVKTSSGSAVNIVICLVTVGSEQLFTFAAFKCPCLSKNETISGGLKRNALYGWVFIVVPAMALFVLGYGMNVKTWKLLTGCVKRSSQAARGYTAGCITLLEIFTQALVAPLAWMSVAFLDGKYYACAATMNPYVNPCVDVVKTTRNAFTEDYDANTRKSQIIGWVLVAATLFFGSVFYMIHRCCSPLTYHHRKYARWYRELETKAFEDKALAQIKAEVQLETVERFLQKKRDKYNWDKISTVFNFTRDKSNYALYSRLDEWNEEHKESDPLPSEVDKGEEAREVEDDYSIEEPNHTKNNNNNSIGANGGVTTENGDGNAECAEIPLGKAKKDQAKEPLIPKIPKLSPPPSKNNKNAKRRSTADYDECQPTMTSHETTNFMTSQVTSETRDCAQQHLPENIKNVTSQQQQSCNVTSQSMKSSLSNNDDAMKDDLIILENLKQSKSMPTIADTRANLENGRIQIKRATAPSYDDDDDVTSSLA